MEEVEICVFFLYPFRFSFLDMVSIFVFVYFSILCFLFCFSCVVCIVFCFL